MTKRQHIILFAALTLLGGCRAARFKSLSVAPALAPQQPAPLDPAIANILNAYAPIGFQRTWMRIPLQPLGPTNIVGGTGVKPSCCTFNVSNRPAPPGTARSAYFLSSAKGQAEIVKLFAGAANTGGAGQVKALFDTLYNSDEKTPASTNKVRVESTFTHLLDAVHDWDRLQYVGVFLMLKDPEVRFTDTNQFESIMRDIEVGTLTQTVTAAGKIGGKKTNYTGATVAGNLSSLPVMELSPELSVSYADALQRKLKEQLNFRSASIEAGGRLFRLVQRASSENAIPSMTRQVLTLEFGEKVNLAQLKLEYEKGTLKSVGVDSFSQPQFRGVVAREKERKDFDVNYEIKATPVMLSAVRKIRNERGVKTLGFDDDDRVEYDMHLDAKPEVTVTTVRVRQWAIRFRLKGSEVWRYLDVRRNPADPAATAVFGSDLDASRFATFLRQRLSVLTAEQLKEGHLLGGLPDLDQEFLRFGRLTEGAMSLTDVDAATVAPILVPFGGLDDGGAVTVK
ncbi:MAG: hypothetical protein JNM66_08030 [Bryobacterales bacterium]|nr:hypothetical protein [Bryobacterales bacterium]